MTTRQLIKSGKLTEIESVNYNRRWLRCDGKIIVERHVGSTMGYFLEGDDSRYVRCIADAYYEL